MRPILDCHINTVALYVGLPLWGNSLPGTRSGSKQISMTLLYRGGGYSHFGQNKTPLLCQITLAVCAFKKSNEYLLKFVSCLTVAM